MSEFKYRQVFDTLPPSNKAKDIKVTKAESTIPEKNAILIYRKFSCVHTDRTLPLTLKGGWEFTQSSAVRSQMVSASCGLNKK